MGDALRILNNALRVGLRNNILWSQSGYALTVDTTSQVGFTSDYNDLYTPSGKTAFWGGQDYVNRANWYFQVGFDGHGFSANPQFVNAVGADGILGYSGGADRGVDDDFHLQLTSPSIDAGDLAGMGGYYLSETGTGASANGGRIEQGAFGNTSQATPSPTRTVQVLGPNGLEKQQAGQTTTITWRSFGLRQVNTVALINAGGSGVGAWLPSAYQTVFYANTSFANAVDLTGVPNPAPQSVYQTVAYAQSGVGNKIAYQLPVPNGTYTIRLHFAEGFVTAAGQRTFDVKLQGSTVRSAYDVYAAAGARFKATALSFTVNAIDGAGILLELVNVLSVAELSGIEITQSAAGVANPTVNLSYSSDGGVNWTAIPGASSLTMDNLGRGSFDWAIPAGLASGNYLVRVASNDFAGVTDAGDASFQLANSGHNYYVNDNISAGDQYTTALGNDVNDGKSPSTPMASIAAVLAAYHPGAGDTLYVDTGVYLLGGNLLLNSTASGLKIVGATTNAPAGGAYASGGILPDAPVAYYRLGDAGATASDSSGHGANGSFIGGVAKGTPGVLAGDSDTGVTLDGSSGKVQLASGAASGLAVAGGSFSWEGWVYPTTSVAGQAFFDLGNGQANDNIWFGRGFSNVLQLQIYRGNSQVGNLYTGGVLEQNKWQYFAVTIDGAGNAVIYKNGVAIASNTLTTPNAVVRNSNYLGKDNWTNDPFFGGQMDEMAFYDKALSAGQIRSHYDLGTAKGTLLDRASTTAGNFGIELKNADNVTLDHLNITGAYEGIHTTSTGAADASSNLTISNGSVLGNNNAGIDTDAYSDHTIVSNETAFGLASDGVAGNDQPYGIYLQGSASSVTGSTAHDDSNTGITVLGDGSTVSGSTAYNNSTGINVGGSGSVGTGNLVYANSTGISGYYTGGLTGVTLSNNTAHDNTVNGIWTDRGSTATGNTAYAQTANNAAGIRVGVLSQGALNNVSYGNFNGIVGDFQGNNGTGLIQGNRVYANSNNGIVSQESAVRNNRVYSNGGIGIAAGGSYGGEISGNVVYANGVAAIVINANSDNGGAPYFINVLNNTVYQPVGDALRILNNAPRVTVRNNILQVTAGYDISLDPTSYVGFSSDYNDLSRGNDPRAHVGLLGGATRDLLADWLSATLAALGTQQDTHSIAGDPIWVDIDGTDNVLGYTTANGGYDGGADDNFYVSAHSPAIDSGYSWLAPHADNEGFNRFDDPGTITNTGSSDYRENTLGSAPFALGGTAKNWRSNNTYFPLTLPFAFPYFGGSYTTAYVSTEGFLQFNTNTPGDPANSVASLAGALRIASMWDDLRTDQAGNDIFVDTSVANQIAIRWNATNQADGSNANFSATLFSDGRVRFNYGAGNTNLSPTVGLSAGNGMAYLLSNYNGQGSLTNANGVEFTLSPGFVDMGAYEFRGASVDATPPTITSTVPVGVNANGTTPKIGKINIGFSEQLNSIDAAAASGFEVRGAGADNLFDTADDIRYTVSPTYLPGSTQVTLNITGATSGTGTVLPWSGALPLGKFRLTVFSLVSGGIHDLSGLELDGDNNGSSDGNYVRTFTVTNTTPAVTAMSPVTIFAGVPLNVNGSFTDPDTDTWSGAVDYNDGTGVHPLTLNPDKSFNLSDLYPSPGVHTVTVTIADADGAIGTGTLSVTVNNPTGLSISPGGAYTITGAPGAPVLNVISGTVTITPAIYAIFPSLGANVAGGASLLLNGSQHLASLTLADGANASAGGSSTLTVDAISLTGAAKLDLGTGYLIVNYPSGQGAAALAQVTSLISSGNNGGAWNGPGIDSSAAAASSGKSIGVENNNNGSGGAVTPAFGGQSVGPNAILVRYTLKGDANLDGTVGFADLVAVAQHYGTVGNTWATGDFDFDGSVGFTDLVAVAQAYGQSVPATADVPLAAGVSLDEQLAPALVASSTPTVAAASEAISTVTPAATVAKASTTTASKPSSAPAPLRSAVKPTVSRPAWGKVAATGQRAASGAATFSATAIVPNPTAEAKPAPQTEVLSAVLKVSRRSAPQAKPIQLFSQAKSRIGIDQPVEASPVASRFADEKVVGGYSGSGVFGKKKDPQQQASVLE